MTNHFDSELLSTVLQLLTTDCSSGFAEGLRLLVNEAMVQERSAVLHAHPYERCEGRLGRANGFKPKSLAPRVGPTRLSIPQVRDGVEFYPSALEKGARSEKALLLALTEMYVQGKLGSEIGVNVHFISAIGCRCHLRLLRSRDGA